MRASRSGITLVEALVSSLLGLLVLILASQLFVQAGRSARDVEQLDAGLIALNTARVTLGRDLASGAGLSGTPVTPTSLQLSVPVGLSASGAVQVQEVEFTLEGEPGQVWLLRRGQRVAGPFVSGYFERTTSSILAPAAQAKVEDLVRLVLSVKGTSRGLDTVLAVSEPLTPRQLYPGLLAWSEVVP